MNNSGDGWAVSPTGVKRWGIAGAAGLFLVTLDSNDRPVVLLQHRAPWTNQGNTWGIPGGARNIDETTEQAALRETEEETGINLEHVTILAELPSAQMDVEHALRREPLNHSEIEQLPAGVVSHLSGRDPGTGGQAQSPNSVSVDGKTLVKSLNGDLFWEHKDDTVDQWAYTTVIASTDQILDVVADHESSALEWWPLERIHEIELLPSFQGALPQIQTLLEHNDLDQYAQALGQSIVDAQAGIEG